MSSGDLSSTISYVTLVNVIATFVLIMVILGIVVIEMWKTTKSIKSKLDSDVERILLVHVDNYEEAAQIVGKPIKTKLKYIDDKRAALSKNSIRKEGVSIG